MAILFGPSYAVTEALIVSTTEHVWYWIYFCFSRSVIGALFSRFSLFRKRRKLVFAFVGEVIGTGILGAIAIHTNWSLLLFGEKS